MTRLGAERLAWGFVTAILLVRLVLSRYHLFYPGLDMDETLFVNAATRRLPNFYINDMWHGVPLTVFPYIGALKSWIYTPIFGLFGTSPIVIRFPAVVIASAGLALLYPALRNFANRSVALLAVTALAFDNSIFWLTRNDVGPNALEFFFKCAAIAIGAQLVRGPRARWVVALVAVMALGTFNKLNFVWVLNASLVILVLVALTHRQVARRHWRLLIGGVAGLGLVYLCWALYYLLNDIGGIGGARASGSVLAFTWPQWVRGTEGILSGTWFYNYALSPGEPPLLIVYVVVALFAAGAAGAVRRGRTRNLPVACLALMVPVLVAQLLVTRQATAGWHYIAIDPYVTIVGAYGGWVIVTTALRRPVRVAVALVALGLATVTYDGILMGRYFSALDREPSNPAWTPAIYSLGRYLGYTRGSVILADWGIVNPLFALDQNRPYEDLSFELMDGSAASLATFRAQVAASPAPQLIITHAAGKIVFPQENANLLKAEARHLRVVKRIPGDGGTAVYVVYEITA